MPEPPNRIAAWCVEHGWTLTDISGLSGYSLSYLSLVARGKRSLGPDAKVRIAHAVGATVAELFPVGEGSPLHERT